MKIIDIESMEEWNYNSESEYRASLRIKTNSEEEIEKIADAYNKGHSIYVFTDREIEDIYKKKVTDEDKQKQLIDYLVEKLDKVLKKNKK